MRRKQFPLLFPAVIMMASVLSGCVDEYPIQHTTATKLFGYTEYVYVGDEEEAIKVTYPTTASAFKFWLIGDEPRQEIYESCRAYYEAYNAALDEDHSYDTVSDEEIRDYAILSYTMVDLAEEYLGVDLAFDHYIRDVRIGIFGYEGETGYACVRTVEDDPVDFVIAYNYYGNEDSDDAEDKDDDAHFARIDVSDYYDQCIEQSLLSEVREQLGLPSSDYYIHPVWTDADEFAPSEIYDDIRQVYGQECLSLYLQIAVLEDNCSEADYEAARDAVWSWQTGNAIAGEIDFWYLAAWQMEKARADENYLDDGYVTYRQDGLTDRESPGIYYVWVDGQLKDRASAD